MRSRLLGPDAARYWYAAQGVRVPRPFNLRWLLPKLLGPEWGAWSFVWWASWPLLGFGTVAWRLAAGDSFGAAVAVAVLLLALPGVQGPDVCRPVSVDLPALAVTMWAMFLLELGHPAQIAAGVAVLLCAASIKESAPVVAAVTVWTPWALLALAAPLVAWLLIRPGVDPLGTKFQRIADHPVRTALDAHRGQWRNGWIMVAPWGVTLAALYGADWRLAVVLAVAYAQLLVATDSVRLYQTVAGPAMAAAAVAVIPVLWLPLAVVLHVMWFRAPQRV